MWATELSALQGEIWSQGSSVHFFGDQPRVAEVRGRCGVGPESREVIGTRAPPSLRGLRNAACAAALRGGSSSAGRSEGNSRGEAALVT